MPVQHEPDGGGEHEGDDEGGEADQRDRYAADVDVAAGIARIDRPEVGAEEELREIGDDDAQAEGDQKRVEHRRADDQVEDEALQEVAEHEHHERGDRQRGEGVDAEPG